MTFGPSRGPGDTVVRAATGGGISVMALLMMTATGFKSEGGHTWQQGHTWLQGRARDRGRLARILSIVTRAAMSPVLFALNEPRLDRVGLDGTGRFGDF
ncbi:MAG TPA: hypothetical protein PLJ27_25915 [Polyangiaceae bacterium]|nr:hypothetical protein [Polyangiaceae bacterium]HQK20926.1 hypothetical protein [Polyangiaceae bacterium]